MLLTKYACLSLVCMLLTSRSGLLSGVGRKKRLSKDMSALLYCGWSRVEGGAEGEGEERLYGGTWKETSGYRRIETVNREKETCVCSRLREFINAQNNRHIASESGDV